MKRGKPERYIALATEIRQLIKRKRLKRNDALPSERKMAELFACSHLTVRKSLHLLEQEKLIYKEPSRGNFVGTRPPKAGKSGLIGFIFPDDEIFYYKLFAQLEKSFSEAGLHPVVHLTHSIKEKEERILDFLNQVNAEVVVAVPNAQCQDKYRELDIPVIFFDLNIKELNIPAITSDDYRGAVSATEHLISLGHRHIAHIGGIYERTSELRLQGYRDTLKKYQIDLSDKLVKQQTPSREMGYYAAKELFECSTPPTALFCGNDTIAAGVIRYLNANKINCPIGCSIVGFGNTAIAEDLNLTSVSQNSPKIADALRNHLRFILNGETPPPETIIPTSLIIRESSGICLT
ncbi:MAG: GntR family transcriptional regulator [Victivallaceae bacterium]|nr:GntR family transcriptional regulator [Victivallaceae bacterium]